MQSTNTYRKSTRQQHTQHLHAQHQHLQEYIAHVKSTLSICMHSTNTYRNSTCQKQCMHTAQYQHLQKQHKSTVISLACTEPALSPEGESLKTKRWRDVIVTSTWRQRLQTLTTGQTIKNLLLYYTGSRIPRKTAILPLHFLYFLFLLGVLCRKNVTVVVYFFCWKSNSLQSPMLRPKKKFLIGIFVYSHKNALNSSSSPNG